MRESCISDSRISQRGIKIKPTVYRESHNHENVKCSQILSEIIAHEKAHRTNLGSNRPVTSPQFCALVGTAAQLGSGFLQNKLHLVVQGV